jgi:hypothetical protein
MSNPKQYQVTLSDDGSLTYADTSLFAVDDVEAKQKARAWVESLDLDDQEEDVWLVLNENGRGIACKPGTF